MTTDEGSSKTAMLSCLTTSETPKWNKCKTFGAASSLLKEFRCDASSWLAFLASTLSTPNGNGVVFAKFSRSLSTQHSLLLCLEVAGSVEAGSVGSFSRFARTSAALALHKAWTCMNLHELMKLYEVYNLVILQRQILLQLLRAAFHHEMTQQYTLSKYDWRARRLGPKTCICKMQFIKTEKQKCWNIEPTLTIFDMNPNSCAQRNPRTWVSELGRRTLLSAPLFGDEACSPALHLGSSKAVAIRAKQWKHVNSFSYCFSMNFLGIVIKQQFMNWFIEWFVGPSSARPVGSGSEEGEQLLN